MNYSDLIDQLAEATGNSKVKTKELLGDAISVLSDQLSKGSGVSIPDLGTFSTKVKDVQKMYNPHHEAYLLVPPKRIVEFTPASGLKNELKYTGRQDE
jgi:DNA-binding protein HU-beta